MVVGNENTTQDIVLLSLHISFTFLPYENAYQTRYQKKWDKNALRRKQNQTCSFQSK
jgi:hypothetical protein